MGTLGRRGSARGERVGRPAVGAEPPASARRLVHRPAHERVAEDEAAGNLRGRGSGPASSRSSSAFSPSACDSSAITAARSGLERLAGDCRRVEERARRRRQRLQLPGDRALDRGGQAALGSRSRRAPRSDPLPMRARAARGRRGCRRRGGRSPRSTRHRRPGRAARQPPPRVSCCSSSRVTGGFATAAERRSSACPGRKPSASSTGASGARPISAETSSIEAPSLQCRSSSTSTSGCPPAISPSSRRTARCVR